jgi:hypothetical protein
MEPIDRQPNESCNSHNEDVTVITIPVNHILAFSDMTLIKENFTDIGRQVTWLILDKCISDKWRQILNGVAHLTEVTELSITRCALRDKHLQRL